MSEYTDYYALRTDDPAWLRDALVAAGAEAVIFDTEIETPARPAWCPVALFGDDAVLARLGPAIHIRVDEDQHGWQLSLLSEEGYRSVTFFDRPFGQDGHVPDGFLPVPPAPIPPQGEAFLARFFGLDWAVLRPVLVPGGFEAFCDATGLPCLILLDQHIRIPPPGGAVLASELG
ncbi:hypothetical protein [Pseudoroseomonas cervicalis]|uniref:hypothetical protein n=1 Tax=Teichococcus cervicalis TaxID=204525 RepID=UPI0027825659|nr:hypothetical protein [Pseudoroseomonas cervicalis]MDQ1077826.1 hypothetical protein [Pseudoroseomonas cervicalis]